MKNILFIAILLASLQSQAQVYYPVLMHFHVAGVKNQKDLDKFRFGYIDDGNSLHQTLAFETTEKLFLFKCGSIEAEARIVIEKNKEFMVIYVDRSWSEIMKIKFKPGYFRVKNNKLIVDERPKPDLELTVAFDVEVFETTDDI